MSKFTRQHYARPERRRFNRSGYVDIFEGCGGVMVRPNMFDARVWDIPEIARSVDDIWLSGMLELNNVPIWLIANVIVPENTQAQSAAPLAEETFAGYGRWEANKAVVEYLQNEYGIWLG